METARNTEGPSKEKELLPDILAHQDRVRDQRMRLSVIIRTFESEWQADVKEEVEKGDPDDRALSTVDMLYLNMEGLETQLEALIARTQTIQARYLGSKP